jgi:hypothetical protein
MSEADEFEYDRKNEMAKPLPVNEVGNTHVIISLSVLGKEKEKECCDLLKWMAKNITHMIEDLQGEWFYIKDIRKPVRAKEAYLKYKEANP